MYYATLFEKMPEVYLFSFKGQTTQRNVKSTTTKNPNSCSVPKVELWTLKEKKKIKSVADTEILLFVVKILLALLTGWR